MSETAVQEAGQVGSNLDSITIEIIRNRLDAIANSMQHTLLRSAVAVIAKEARTDLRDCSRSTATRSAKPVPAQSI